jgi:hypothetical protein
MNKFKGKFEELHEETLYRHQQGGFLRGDYVRIKKDALQNEGVKDLSDQLKAIIQDTIKNDIVLRVSYIKSGQSEAFSGPVDAANIPAPELWADCYIEHGPGMWHSVMTLPMGILEKIEIEGANGFAPYNKNLVRPNTEEPNADASELKNRTLGGGEAGSEKDRENPKKNTKLANTKEPRSGMKDLKEKSNTKGSKNENDLIFEKYIREAYGEDVPQSDWDPDNEYGPGPDHIYKKDMVYYELHQYGPAYTWILTAEGERILRRLLGEMGPEEIRSALEQVNSGQGSQNRLLGHLQSEVAATQNILKDLQPRFPGIWRSIEPGIDDVVAVDLTVEGLDDAEVESPADFLTGLGLRLRPSQVLREFDGS